MMRLRYLGIVALLGFAIATAVAQEQPTAKTSVTLASGTKVGLAVTAPVWAKTAQAGDPVYLQTIFPVVADGRVAIPAGTYVQGTLLALTRPTRHISRAQVEVLFNKIIFANGYAVALPDQPAPSVPAISVPAATAARLTIQVSAANDLLLDNGTQFEMTIAAPVTLDAAQVAASLGVTRALVPGALRSATRCRPTEGTPGSPGTPDTVIPGSPGTPSTTIPGGPGMPDITIPGTPATPDTVIPGSPGTPGTMGSRCPAPPMVTSSDLLILSPAPLQSAPAH